MESKKERAIQFLAQLIVESANNIGYEQTQAKILREKHGLLPAFSIDVSLLSANMGASLARAISNHELIPRIDHSGIIDWVTLKPEKLKKKESK